MATNGLALIIITITLMFMITGYFVTGDEFKCKPKPGCTIVKCDPVRQVSIGVLDDREYPIVCEGKPTVPQQGPVSRHEYEQLLKALLRTQAELATVKFDMEFLKAQRAQPNIENTPPVTSSAAPTETTVHTTTISTTKMTTSQRQAGKPLKNPLIPAKPCSLRVDDTCFFMIRIKRQGYNHIDAENECKNQGVTLAVITSEKMYDTLVNALRQEPGSWTYTIWTGMFYSLNMRTITKPGNAYAQWAPGYPISRSVDAMHVAMRISSRPEDWNQGMINSAWDVKYEAVLCQWIDNN